MSQWSLCSHLQATQFFAIDKPYFASIIILQLMDPQERFHHNLRDFFEETALPLRLPLPPSEAGDSCDPQDAFSFNFEQSLPSSSPRHFSPSADHNLDECHSIREDHEYEDTNLLDDFLNDNPPELHALHPSSVQSDQRSAQEPEAQAKESSESELEAIIAFLVEFSNLREAEMYTAFQLRFPGQWQRPVVRTLVEKFRKLKKTREELVKYCMRKAFKFILELPKNRHILAAQEKQEKFSFAKSKNRFIKKISDEKSMNSKFLQQIFHEGDFLQDYQIFLEHFQEIMMEDNRKKVKFLACLLTQNGKQRSAELVRRMPWTIEVLQRARKISLQLLKFGAG